MTSETRTSIEPVDIQTIELECLKCGFRAIWPMGKWLHDDGKCANCDASWPMQRAGAFQSLVQVFKALGDIAKLKDSADIPFRVHFGLKETVEKKKQ